MPDNNTYGGSTAGSQNSGVRFVDMRTAIEDACRVLHRRHQSGSRLSGLPTGFVILDELLDGLHPGHLYIVASRPSMGRTTFALNMVQHVTLEGGKRAAVFSSHESATSLTFRLFASIGRIKTSHLRTGELDNDEWARLSEASSRLTSTNGIFVNDSTTLSVDELTETARQLKEQRSIDLVVVDSLENVRIPGKSANGSAGAPGDYTKPESDSGGIEHSCYRNDEDRPVCRGTR